MTVFYVVGAIAVIVGIIRLYLYVTRRYRNGK